MDVRGLSPAKQALLTRQLQGGPAMPGGLPPVGRREAGSAVPCTIGQRQMWLAAQVAAADPVYNECITILKRGPFDVGAFRRAFNLVMARHEAWRTTFVVSG